MDQRRDLKKQSLSQFIISQFHRKQTQLLLSVSVFSLFFSHSYCLSLFHSFNFNFHNTLPFQLVSHSIDKNCIFLLCNGLLVFLAKYSGLISSSSKHNNLNDNQWFKSYEDVPQSESISFEPKPPLWEKEMALETNNEALQNNILIEGNEKEEAAAEEENADFVEDEQVLVKGPDNELFVQDFEESESFEREEEEGNRFLSPEELNKRFDEFIRKMKEELRIEARQQLFTV